MKPEMLISIANILLTTINVMTTYFNLRFNRRKDLSAACYEIVVKLDVNSTPFVQIYDYQSKEEWTEYCEKNMGELIIEGFALEKVLYKHVLVVPIEIREHFNEFKSKCLSFIKNSYHFDTGLIIENQDLLWDLYE